MKTVFDRRRSHRANHDEFRKGVTGRIRPGHVVRVVNVSTGGVLVETSSRLRPGTSVDLHIEAGGRALDARAEVSRCYVSRLLAHQVMFRAALAFEHEVSWLSASNALATV